MKSKAALPMMIVQATKSGGSAAERGKAMKSKTRMIVTAALATVAMAGMGESALAGAGDIDSKVTIKFSEGSISSVM
jgi:hypothetical protein